MADFEIERPSVDVQAISPTYNVNPPQFTIEVHGSIQGSRHHCDSGGCRTNPGKQVGCTGRRRHHCGRQ